MQMWAVSNLPVYTVDKGTADKKSRTHSVGGGDDSETALLQPPAPSLIRPVPFSSDVTPWDDAVINNNNDNFDVLLGPALDAPPSPESIRKQMQRASARDKHHSHATSSSGSASLRSLTSADRPSWENVLEAGRLSRKSSGRSTSSSMPSKDRPESVQFFGRNLFNRRARLRRESSAQSSASSSVYGGEMGGEPPMPPPPTSIPTNRDSTIPSLFGRRRASKQEQASKFQISGPYNFQHVTHTQKDSLPDLQRTNRQVLAAEFAQVRASQMPADGSLKGIKAQNLHFDNFSSESLALGEEEVIGGLTEPVARSILTRPPSGILKHSPRRLLKRSQSQDQLSIIPPPRPPRSPIEADAPYPPIPPPRTSSRMGSRHERFDSINTNFRYPQPFPLLADAGSPPPTSYGYVPGPDMDVIPEHSHSTHSKTPSMDDPNWPLPCSSTTTLETPLPEVPEEEEETFVPKKSRASIASNSSLRGSVSVPMLRAFSLRKNGDLDRRGSEASDTLGCFDLAAAQRAVEEALNESGDGLIRDSWEDDIDYAYDHEVEADCDYEWHRPSFELSRDSATPVGQSCEVSPAMLLAAQFDVPALSPVSQLSMATAQEAITPTAVTSNIPASLNFSLPKVESKSLLHVRKLSDASSFKESHGFTLSPSLLIPMDFQQQMMAHEADNEFPYRHFDDTAHRYRTSASTTHTLESVHSGFEKHISTASTSTDFTRLTPSTTSLDTDNYPLKPEPLQRFPSFESNRADAIGAMPTLPESEETLQLSTRRREFRSRGSESSLLKLATDEPWPGKAKNSIQARRGRARTTSLSTPPPPNQYTLFPSVQLTGNRI